MSKADAMAAMLASMLCFASSGSFARRRFTSRAHSLPACSLAVSATDSFNICLKCQMCQAKYGCFASSDRFERRRFTSAAHSLPACRVSKSAE